MTRRQSPRRIALCGMLTALMLVLGYVEHLIPVSASLPGVKLGLSNGVVIFALYMLDTPTACLLMLLKVLLSSALYAGFGAAPYALCGGVLSLLTMAAFHRMKGIAPVTVSMLGGAAHNIGQGTGNADHPHPGAHRLHGCFGARRPCLRPAHRDMLLPHHEASEAPPLLNPTQGVIPCPATLPPMKKSSAA